MHMTKRSFHKAPDSLWKDYRMPGHLSTSVETTAPQTIPLAQLGEQESTAWEPEQGTT